ncbi:MAG: cytochrome C [Acidobacteria bacterium]|nr:cytochrome C [Acidobacteriota bacterium]
MRFRSGLGFGVLGLISFLAWSQEEAATPADQPPPVIYDRPTDLLLQFPAFDVEPRKAVLKENGYFPCTDCHDNDTQKANPRIRILEDEHDTLELKHGNKRFWCLSCHDAESRNNLTSREGFLISFNDAHLLCGECHFQQQRDFIFGAHGKRLNSWQGKPFLMPCTGCHDAHDPTIKPALPVAAPQARKGLERPELEPAHVAILPKEGQHD